MVCFSARPALLASRAAAPAMLHRQSLAGPSLGPAIAPRTAAPATMFFDQLDNLAGPLFASSLLPYLTFLYFIYYDGNRLAPSAKLGFATLLAFVAATVVSSVRCHTRIRYSTEMSHTTPPPSLFAMPKYNC